MVFQNTDMKVKMVEAKFHEEKLKLQQKHDSAVQKVVQIVCDHGREVSVKSLELACINVMRSL